MKPTIETSRIRANLRLYAELGYIPTELVSVIERALGLDYVEQQFKKKHKCNVKNLGKALADVLDHYDAAVSFPFGKWEIFGNGFLVNGGGYSFNAHTLRNLQALQAKTDRITKRVKSVKTIEEAREIIAEEDNKIENFIRHGE